MPVANEQTAAPATPPAKVFDENGNEIDAADEFDMQPVDDNPQEAPDEPTDDEAAPDGEQPPAPTATAGGKYRIGDRTFNTMDEAHAYALQENERLANEQALAAAYRQGMQDAVSVQNPTPGVTPQPAAPTSIVRPDDEERMFADPKAFLEDFAQRITENVKQQTAQQVSQKEQGDAIWNEFIARQPAMAEFRREVEDFVEKNASVVKAVIASKGRNAGYDYVTMQLRAQWARYAQSMKPGRPLPNGGGGPAPRGKGAGSVPPKKTTTKPLTMSEQIRSIKKQR